MNQYVLNWDFDEEANMFEINKLPAHSTSLNTLPETVTPLENSLAELTWEKGYMGYVAMQDLDQRVLNTPISPWDDNPRADGTLESVVNQATWHSKPESGLDDINENLLWSNHGIPTMATATATASTAVTFEPLVPRHNNMPMFEFNHEPYTYAQGTGISDVAGCSTQLVPFGVAAASASLGGGWVEFAGVGINNSTVEREILSGMDLTLLVNNISGQDYTKTLADHYDSISHSRSQVCQITEGDEDGKKKLSKGKSPISAKKSRAAAIHNQSERNRRDRINQKMKALQDLVPNSSKTDKVSMLDKAIECVKELQAQVEMMSIMTISPMMMPLSTQQQLEMSMMGVTNNINHVDALLPPVIPPPIMPVSTASLDNSGNCLPTPPTTTIFMPASMVSVMPDPAAAVFACEYQPMTVDAYNWLATMYQQM